MLTSYEIAVIARRQESGPDALLLDELTTGLILARLTGQPLDDVYDVMVEAKADMLAVGSE